MSRKLFLSYIDNKDINSIINNKLFLSIIFSLYNLINNEEYFLSRTLLRNLKKALLSSIIKNII